MIIAVAMRKGGSGKTSTAAAIWAAFPRSLAVDLDDQGDFTLIAGANAEPEYDIYDVLMQDCEAQDAIQTLSVGDFIASSDALADVGELSPIALRDALTPIKSKYKHVILDAPPSLGRVTINALMAADILVVPTQADVMSLKDVGKFKTVIDAVQEVNTNLRVAGILLTRFSPRSVVRRQMQEAAESFAEGLGTHIFKSTIREAVAVLEAQGLHRDIYSYAPDANVTSDYRAFIAELSEVIENG